MQTNIEYLHIAGVPVSSGVFAFSFLLTVHVHQDADIGGSDSVEHLTGHRLSEEGVICCGDKDSLSGPL